MAADITYTKTTRGQSAFVKKLPDSVGQVLVAIEGGLTEEQILAKLHNVSESAFREAMTWLLEGGFVRIVDSEPFVISQPSPITGDAIQVQEISIDEFDALSNAVVANEKSEGKTVGADDVFNIFAQAATNKPTNVKKKSKAEKEKARREAIETTKRITAAKAEEKARLSAETEAQKQAEVMAKKERWAKLKAEAEKKAAADKRLLTEASALARTEERERIQSAEKAHTERLVQLKAEAKAQAELEAELTAIATVKKQIKLQRLAKEVCSKMRLKQGVLSLFAAIKSLIIFGFVGLCLLIAAAHVINLNRLANPIEKTASQKLQDDVNVAAVYIRLFPKPHLLLKKVSISSVNYAEKIRIYPNLTNLKNKFVNVFDKSDSTPYEFTSLNIEGLTIKQKELVHVRSWARAIANNQPFIFHRLVVEDLSLKMNGLSLPLLQADISLSQTDAFKSAVFYTKEKNFNLIVHDVNGDYLIDIDATNWRPPLSPPLSLTSLNATGVVKNNDLTFSSITGRLYGGTFSAKLQTNLSSPRLATKGSFKLNGVVLNSFADDTRINAIVTGDLDSRGSFSFNINQFTNTINSAIVDASFGVKGGVLHKIDIAEAMRSKNINGSTNFTTLTGKLLLKNNRYQLTDLHLQDNQLQVYGQATISADQQVSATVSSVIAIQNNPISTDLVIEGSINSLRLIQ